MSKRPWIIAVSAASAALSIAATAHVAPAEDARVPFEPFGRYEIGLWGDMPYSTPPAPDTETAKVESLVDDMNRFPLAFAIFDGDIKGGSAPCTDDVYATAVARFNRFRMPMVYVPGDNEWTDCHRINNGGYDNLERLAHVRTVLANTPFSFGRRKMWLERQGRLGAEQSENVRFSYGRVAYLGLNVPGSNNNKVSSDAECTKKSARTLAQCAADNAEYAARDAANIAFLHDTFREARARRARGVMVVIQADPGFDLPETEDVNERNLPQYDGYTALLAALADETRAFDGQVVLVHGDTHFFKVDKPLVDQAHLIPNFTRLETFGSPNVHWVRVIVDPRSENVFTFEPRIVPGN